MGTILDLTHLVKLIDLIVTSLHGLLFKTFPGIKAPSVMKRLRYLIIICCVFFLPVLGWAKSPLVRVAISKAPLQILNMPLEEYLLGVLYSEVPADWPLEALKAQAIAARTYTLYRKQYPQSPAYDLEAGIIDQTFVLRNTFPDLIRQAIKSTRGKALHWEGELIPAFYHSCCGGQSEQAKDVWTWAKHLPFYEIKQDPYCRHCPHQTWELEISKDELTSSLQVHQLARGDIDHVIPFENDTNYRVRSVGIVTDMESIEISGNRFRQLIGYERLRSTNFNILELGNRLLFVGSGNGHGVGLCQWGGRGMAHQGKTYQDILRFYYPGVEVKRAY